MNPIQIIYLLILSFSLICCQGMHFTPLDQTQERESSLDDEDDFPSSFKSNMMDVVIVAHTSEEMNPILQEIFDTSFIHQFRNYDWKVAYTNTSVGADFIGDSMEQEEKRNAKKKNLCSSEKWALRILAIGIGYYLQGPLTLTGGVLGTGSCAIKAGLVGIDAIGGAFQKYRKKEEVSVDGQLLSFERGGSELENYLTKNQEDYESILSDTFKIGTASYNQFDAPQIQEGSSDPLAAALLALLRGKEFIRKGSQAYFVLITPKDAEQAVSFSQIQKVFQQVHGEDNDLQIIPVALTRDSEMSCVRKLESAGIDSPEVAVNLQESISERAQPIDICAPDLSNQLAKQIKQFVRPAG